MDEKPVRWKKKPACCFESSRDKCMLRFGGYLLRFHLASDWSRNNKDSINFLRCSWFYGNDCNLRSPYYRIQSQSGLQATHITVRTSLNSQGK